MICEDGNEAFLFSSAFQQEVGEMKEFILVKKLSHTKFPVFLAYAPSLDNYFAVKVFPYANDQISPYFLNEIAFSSLKHPNVISIKHHEPEANISIQEHPTKSSYIVMEFAQYGDFFDLIVTNRVRLDEKLVRTFFRQLIEGIEHIHRHVGAHLDLKLENLLLGENFEVKIADFDNSYIQGKKRITSKGTQNYRAPEISKSNCRDPRAADIYSAGIILFVLKCGGTLPHSENQKLKDLALSDLLYNDNAKFWAKHAEIQGIRSSFFDEPFRSLFNHMVKVDPQQRATIEDIKGSDWYNGPIYSQEDLSLIMKGKLNLSL